MLIDLHVHSNFSPCSGMSPQEAIEAAKQAGLDGICFTDHGTSAVAGGLRTGLDPGGFLVVVGLEYTTPQGDFLLYGLERDPRPGLEAPELLALVRASGGAVVAGHPRRGARPVRLELPHIGLIHAAEGLNGRCNPMENQAALAWARRDGLSIVGGSDAHSPAEVGRVATLFPFRLASAQDLTAALKAGCGSPWAVSELKIATAVRL